MSELRFIDKIKKKSITFRMAYAFGYMISFIESALKDGRLIERDRKRAKNILEMVEFLGLRGEEDQVS